MTYRLTDKHYKKAAKNGISKQLLYMRVYNGWDLDKAVSEPKRAYREVKQEHIYFQR